MYFFQRSRTIAWTADRARLERRVRELVPELSPAEAEFVQAELAEFNRLPCPRAFFESTDFCRAVERFDWYLHAIECGAKPSLLGSTAYVAQYGPIGADVF